MFECVNTGIDSMNLHRKALRLEYFTVFYNGLEATASIIAGHMAGSIALIGFGLDSIVESLSGFVLIWRLKKHGSLSPEKEERVERRASRFVGTTFFILGLYVLVESVQAIALNETAESSFPGIVIASVSLLIMPVLGWGKLRIGKKLGYRSLIADAKETFVCSFLSFALLLGLMARSLLNFYLADAFVGLLIAGYVFKEGYELLFEKDEKENE